MKKLNSWRLGEYLVFIMLAAGFLLVAYPMFWTVLSSFKSTQELYKNMWGLPSSWRFDNYSVAWNKGISGYLKNSVIVTLSTIFFVLAITSLCAYGLSRYRFRFMTPVLVFCMGGMMISPHVCLIPLYVLLTDLGIRNTYLALIIPYAAFRAPLIMLLIRAYFLGIPKEIEESASIDGCSDFGVYWRIFLPMSVPIMLTGAILIAYYAWNEFLFAIIFIDSDKLRTVPSGLMNFRDALQVEWGPILAGMVLSVLPLATIFICMQKYFIKGLTAGSVKG